MTDNEIYTAIPEGWKLTAGATSHPRGFRWINNGKSMFDKDYRQALLKENNNDTRI